jgi:CMP-N,N'-diacetyllegionaminic acid synthase
MAAVLALIPARGGSKGLPGKNLLPLAGQSLVARAGAVARESGVVDRIVLSTDAQDIADEGRRAGIEVPFMRPEALAGDETPMLPVIRHALEALAAERWLPDVILLLQPTSPLRQPAHLRDAVAMLRDTGADSVVSVVEVPRHMSPDYVMQIAEGALKPFLPEGERTTRRQDARPAYVRDGTVYAFRRETIERHGSIYGARCVPLILRSEESVTIDVPEDWAAAERLLRAQAGSAGSAVKAQ